MFNKPIPRYEIKTLEQCEHCSDDTISFDAIERDPVFEDKCLHCKCTVYEDI